MSRREKAQDQLSNYEIICQLSHAEQVSALHWGVILKYNENVIRHGFDILHYLKVKQARS